MKYCIITWVLLFFLPIKIFAQDKVLIFTKTNGFSHPSIDEGATLIKQLGKDNGLWTTVTTNDSAEFTTENLSDYKVVVWCNTSGNNLLNETQQKAFEDFVKNGGGFVGIHAATDTYRDQSWPFYNELVGGIVRTNPNHTDSNFSATMQVTSSHPAVNFLGNSWTKVEEYYYWEGNGGFLYDQNINILEVESTGNEIYDEARPVAWYKEYEGGRSFYTALGHNETDYTEDEDFKKHIEEGIKYALGLTLNFSPVAVNKSEISLLNNPVEDILAFHNTNNSIIEDISIYTIQGNLVLSKEIATDAVAIDVSVLPSGLYIAKATVRNKNQVFRFIKK